MPTTNTGQIKRFTRVTSRMITIMEKTKRRKKIKRLNHKRRRLASIWNRFRPFLRRRSSSSSRSCLDRTNRPIWPRRWTLGPRYVHASSFAISSGCPRTCSSDRSPRNRRWSARLGNNKHLGRSERVKNKQTNYFLRKTRTMLPPRSWRRFRFRTRAVFPWSRDTK